MADKSVKVVIGAVDQASGVFKTVSRSADDLKKSTSALTGPIGALKGAFAGLAGPMGALKVAMGTIGTAAVIRGLVDANIQMDALQRKFQVFTGSAGLAARELRFVNEESSRLGLNMQELASSYGRFLNAVKGTSMEGERSRRTFIGLTEGMKAIGLSAEMQDRAWVQLTQGIMKGKFELEDLKSITEGGLPIFKLMADALDVNVETFMKMQREGKVLAVDVLPKLGEQMHQVYGPDAANAAGNLASEIERLGTAWFKLKASVMEGGGESFGVFLARQMQAAINGVNDLWRALDKASAKWTVLVSPGLAAWAANQSGLVAETREDAQNAAFNLPAADVARLRQQFINAEQYNSPRKTAQQIEEEAKAASASAAKLKDSIQNLKDMLADTKPGLSDLDRTLLNLDQRFKDVSKNKQVVDLLEQVKDNLRRTDAEEKAKKAIEEQTKALEAYNAALQKILATEENQWRQREANPDGLFTDYGDIGKLVDGLSGQGGLRDLQNQLAAVQLWAESFPERGEEAALAMRQIRLEMAAISGTAMGGAITALEEYRLMAADVAGQTASVVTQFFTGMEDALVQFVREGKASFEDLVDSILDNLARIVVQQGLMGPLSGALQGIVGSLFSSTAAVQTAPAGFNAFGTIISSLGSTIGESVFTAAKAGTTAGSMAGITSGMATVAPYLMAGMVAYQVGSDYFGHGGVWNSGSSGQKTSRAIAMTNPIGWTALGIDYLAGGGLFGTSWKTTGSGLSLGVDGGGLDAQWYTDQKKKKSLFRGTAKRTKYSAVDELLYDYLSGMFGDVRSSISEGAGYLGGSGDLSGFSFASKKVSLKGLDAEGQEKAIAAYFKELSDAAITSLYPTIADFAKLGESATDTFNRLTSSIKTVNDNFDLIGARLVNSSLDGAAAAAKLVDAMGGLQSFAQQVGNYFDVMFTSAQQDALTLASYQREVKSAFADMGMAIPTTKEAFQKIVSGLDVTTDAGAALFASLMDVSTAFAGMIDLSKELAEFQRQLKGDVAARYLDATGNGLAASVLRLKQSQSDELAEAIAKGADTAMLRQVQNMELVNLINQPIAAAMTDIKAAVAAMRGDSGSDSAYAKARSELAKMVQAAWGGDFSNIGDISGLVGTLTSRTADSYSSLADYKRDMGQTLAQLQTLEGLGAAKLDPASETAKLMGVSVDLLKSQHLSQIKTLNDQLNVLLSINAALNPTAAAYSALPGATAVPVYKPAAATPAPVPVVVTDPRTARWFGHNTVRPEDDPVVKEIRTLREDINAANYAIAENTRKTAKHIEQWEGDGMPETRVA